MHQAGAGWGRRSSNIGVSQRGDVVFIDGSSSWNVPLEIRRWDGTRETVAPSIPDFTQYSMSREGRYIVMTGQDAVRDPDIYTVDVPTGEVTLVYANDAPRNGPPNASWKAYTNASNSSRTAPASWSAPPHPRRTVRYIQDVVGRMEERLVGR